MYHKLISSAMGEALDTHGIPEISAANFPGALVVYNFDDVPTSGATTGDETTDRIRGYRLLTGLGTRNASTGFIANIGAMTKAGGTQPALPNLAAGHKLVGFTIAKSANMGANGLAWIGNSPATDVSGARINNSAGSIACNDGSGAVVAGTTQAAGDGVAATLTVGIFDVGRRMRGFRYNSNGVIVNDAVSLIGEGAIDLNAGTSMLYGVAHNPAFSGWFVFTDSAPPDGLILNSLIWSYNKLMDEQVKALHPVLMGYA